MVPVLFQMSGLPLSCVRFLQFGPNLSSQRNIVVFNAQPSLDQFELETSRGPLQHV